MTRQQWLRRGGLALLLLGPLAITPGGLDRFVLVKAGAVAAGAALVLAGPPSGRLPRPAWVLLVTGGLLLVISAVLSQAPLPQLLGRGPRFEGVFVLAVYVLAAAAAAATLSPWAPDPDRVFAARVLAVGAAVLAVWAVVEAWGLRPLSSTSDRPGALLGNATDQGAWAVLALGLLAAVWWVERDRWVLTGVLSAAVVVVLSGSRAAMVGAIATLLVAGIATRGRRALPAATIAAAALALAALVTPWAGDRITGVDPVAGSSWSGRFLLWQDSLALLVDHIPMGVGPSGFIDAIPSVHGPDWYPLVGTVQPPDSPHNVILQSWSAGGVGLVLVAAMLGALAVRTALRMVQSADGLCAGWAAGALAALVGYLVVLLTTPTSPGPSTLAAVLAGSTLAAPAPDAATAHLRRRVPAIIASGIAVILLLGAAAEIPLRAAIQDLQAGDSVAADNSFRVVARLRPWDAGVPLTAGHAYAVLTRAGDGQAAQWASAWLDQASRWLPDSPGLLADRATVAEAAGDIPQALSLVDRALERDPRDPALHQQRGILLAAQGRWSEAEAAFMTAASGAPRSPEPWLNLARLYQQQGMDGRVQDAQREADRRRTDNQ